MSPAPTLHGYICRVCGEEKIEQPWNASDRFMCKNCGALNHTPLLTVGADQNLRKIVGISDRSSY